LIWRIAFKNHIEQAGIPLQQHHRHIARLFLASPILSLAASAIAAISPHHKTLQSDQDKCP